MIWRSVREMDTPFRVRVFTAYTWRIAAVLAGLIVLGTGLYAMGEPSIPDAFVRFRASLVSIQRLLDMVGERVPSGVVAPSGQSANVPPLQDLLDVSSRGAGVERAAEMPSALEEQERPAGVPESPVARPFEPTPGVHKAGQHTTAEDITHPQNIAFPVIKSIKKGDAVSKYALEVYGNSNSETLEFIKKHNPNIKDIDYIKVGEKMIFPGIVQQ
jgi:hypothetical protein